MSRIAIFGTEGAGKSTLITVFAKKYGDEGKPVALTPMTRATMKFVNSGWHALQSRNWLAPTAPGELLALHWGFRCGMVEDCDLRILDCAGQDLRLLFGEERVNDPDTLPDRLKELAAYYRDADIVLFVVNLKDFVGEGDPERRDDNLWAVKYAIDCRKRYGNSTRFCLVFTQIDQYRPYLQQHGSWLHVARDHLPEIYGAYLERSTMAVIGVAAVCDTEVEVHPQLGPRPVPSANFSSEGLDELTAWIVAQLKDISDEEESKRRRAEEEGRREKETAARQEREKVAKKTQMLFREAVLWALLPTTVIAVVVFVLAYPFFSVLVDQPVFEDRKKVEEKKIWDWGQIPPCAGRSK